MPVRTAEELKKYFLAGNKPSQLWWNNFFDSLALLEAKAEEAYRVNGPIIWVADQAARLLIGPRVSIGRMVKQTDTGRTYVKQQQTGANVGDWEDIGDSQIVISDVENLPDELASRLRNDANDSTSGVLGATNFWNTQDTAALAPVTDLGSTVRVDMLIASGPHFSYAEVEKDFTIHANLSGGNPSVGITQTLIVRNTSASPVQFNRPAGSSTQRWVITNGDDPIVLVSGYIMTLAVTPVIMPDVDPDYGGPGSMYYFITYGSQATAEI